MEDLCKEKHKTIDEKFGRHEKWIGEHETKIDELEKSDAKNTTVIDNLCKQLNSQTKAIWGLTGVIATAVISVIFSK